MGAICQIYGGSGAANYPLPARDNMGGGKGGKGGVFGEKLKGQSNDPVGILA